jgi:tetratricopeptide (TPR) repeat protein
MGAYFLVHGELDWLEAFPALVMPVAGLAFAVLVLPGAGRTPRAWARPPWLRPVALGLGGAALGAVVVTLGAPYVAERYIERARNTWTAAPTAAFDDLDRAASWNPLSPAPAINQGALALQLGQYKRAARSFHRALAREDNWVPYLELGLIAARDGDFSASRQLLERAAKLDDIDPVITEAQAKVQHRERVDPGAVNALSRQSPLFTTPRIP